MAGTYLNCERVLITMFDGRANWEPWMADRLAISWIGDGGAIHTAILSATFRFNIVEIYTSE